ncbi:MAG: PD-(D/E)XK nuclease family protein [Acidobacteriota bacterium]|nr:MAG: PD-(D/E)XK nuclease family protein [Acidobacteriota bacterium]
MPVYSHSRLTTFEQCPKKFYFRYVKRPDVPEFKGIEMFLGSVAHKALENLYRALLVSKVPAKEDVVKDYHSVWEKEWGDDVTIVKEQYTADDYRRTGERCVADYYDKHHPFDGEGRILGLEENVRFALDDAGQYRMQGVIDRLMEPKPREVEIHDYKSSMRLPSQDDMEKDRQLALYGIGVRQTMPDVGRVEFVWHYLVFGREIRVSPTPAKVEDTRRWAVSTIRRIEREETFEPRESVLCNWCDFQSVCPAKNPAPPKVTPERREALKEGAALVDKWEELEGRRKTLEKGDRRGEGAAQGARRKLRDRFLRGGGKSGHGPAQGIPRRAHDRLREPRPPGGVPSAGGPVGRVFRAEARRPQQGVPHGPIRRPASEKNREITRPARRVEDQPQEEGVGEAATWIGGRSAAAKATSTGRRTGPPPFP